MLPVKQPFTNTKADGGPVGGRKAARQKVRSPSQQPKGENKKMTFEKYNANPDNKNIGDCSIRAICTATPLTYQQAKKLLETSERRALRHLQTPGERRRSAPA